MPCDIMIYRLYDTANGIDLEKAAALLAAGSSVTRLRLTRVPPKSILFKNPPVDALLARQTVELGGRQFFADVRARIYDLGVVSVLLRLSLPDDINHDEFLNLAIAADKLPESHFLTPLQSLMTAIRPVVTGEHPPAINEDLVIYYFRENKDWDPVPLLLGEKETVSAETRRQTLFHTFSYATDYTILGWDKAIVYDPTGSPDIPDLLEFANAQLLELRYYDYVLDREIEKMYDDINSVERRSHFLRMGQYRQIRKKIVGDHGGHHRHHQSYSKLSADHGRRFQRPSLYQLHENTARGRLGRKH